MGTRRRIVFASGRVALLLGVFMVVVAAGCARGEEGPQPGASASGGTVSASPSPSPDLTPGGQLTPSSSATGSKGSASGELTIRGRIEEGVESGCMLLRTDDGKDYLLLGGDRAVIAAGGRVEAVGTPEPGLMTTCQQGTPFQVSQLRRI